MSGTLNLLAFNNSVLRPQSFSLAPYSRARCDGGGGSDLSQEKPLRKSFITGLAVICEMLGGGLFMENTKMEKQRTSEPYPTIMRRTLSRGLGGFWGGFWPWGFVLGMSKGMVLGGSRAFFLNVCMNSGMTEGTSDVVSGFAAGAAQGLVMSPIMLARTRVNQSISERAASGVASETGGGLMHEFQVSMSIMNKDIAKNGWSTLTTGMATMTFKRTIDWGSRFVFAKWTRDYFHSRKESVNGEKTQLSQVEKLMSSVLGGAMSLFVCMPVDRLMPILQAAGRSKDETIQQIIKKKMAQEGLSTLQRGFMMRLVHVSWHTTFAIYISGHIYEAIDKRV
jgi:hypothetical protein